MAVALTRFGFIVTGDDFAQWTGTAASVVLVGRSATRTVRAYERGDRRFRVGSGPDELIAFHPDTPVYGR